MYTGAYKMTSRSTFFLLWSHNTLFIPMSLCIFPFNRKSKIKEFFKKFCNLRFPGDLMHNYIEILHLKSLDPSLND